VGKSNQALVRKFSTINTTRESKLYPAIMPPKPNKHWQRKPIRVKKIAAIDIIQ